MEFIDPSTIISSQFRYYGKTSLPQIIVATDYIVMNRVLFLRDRVETNQGLECWCDTHRDGCDNLLKVAQLPHQPE